MVTCNMEFLLVDFGNISSMLQLVCGCRCYNYSSYSCSNKIEVAYQEAVALKRQEELIREEEAAWLAESGQKAKRTEKEKKSKKKQVYFPSLHIYI